MYVTFVQVPEARGGFQSLWNWRCRWLLAPWMLGMELRSTRRPTRAPNSITSAPSVAPSAALKMSSLSLMSRRLVIVWLCRVSAFLENVGYNFYQIWEMFGYDFCLCNSLPHLLLRLQILMPGVHVILQPLVLSYFFQSYSLPCLLFLFSLLAHCWFFFSLLLFNVSPAVTTTGWTLEIFTARNVKCISLFSLCFLP